MPANNITSSPSGAGPQSQQWNKGPLLFGACATPEFTLIDDGPTAYYAAFVGCISGREECCPFQTRGVAPSITSRPCFPEPLNSRDAFMEHCPSDYHKVHGHCCPSSYTPWTTTIGGVTPCACSATININMVPVTATLAQAAETSTTKPTVTVTDKVFAMQYSVSSQKESLSPGAIAGITVACAVGIAILFGAILLIRRYVKRARDMAALRRSVRDSLNSPVPPPGTSEIPIATPTVAHDMNASWSAGDASVDTHTTTDSYYKPASRPYRPRRNIHESIALQEPSAFSLAKEQRFRPIAELNGPDLLIYRNKTLEDKNPWWKQRPCGDPRWYEPVTVPNEHVAPNVQLAPVGSSIDEPFPRIQRTILKPQTTIIHDNVPVSRPTPGPKKQRGWPLPEPDSEEETVVPRKGREENTEKAEVGMDKKGKRKVTVEANPRAKGHAIIQPDNFI